MSQLIHMDTEIVTKLSASIKQCVITMDERSRSIRTTMESASWEGGSRDDLVYQTANQLTNLSNLKLQLEELSLQLQHEIDQWVQIDRNSITDYLLDNNLLLSGLGLAFGIAPNSLRISHYLIGFMLNKEINEIFNYFEGSQAGEAFQKDVENANIRFEYTDEEGNVHSFGDQNGDPVSISWVSASDLPEGANGGYNNGPPPTIEILDTLKSGSSYELRETIAHEMQHALDYETDRASMDIKYKPFTDLSESRFRNMTQEEIDSYDWSSVEDSFATSCTERVKTEITAHARGYEFNPLKETGEGVLNSDNVYTPQENKIILNDRGYSEIYEQNIRDSFLSQGITVEVDVYWNDLSNSIQVDIMNANGLIEARTTGYA